MLIEHFCQWWITINTWDFSRAAASDFSPVLRSSGWRQADDCRFLSSNKKDSNGIQSTKTWAQHTCLLSSFWIMALRLAETLLISDSFTFVARHLRMKINVLQARQNNKRRAHSFSAFIDRWLWRMSSLSFRLWLCSLWTSTRTSLSRISETYWNHSELDLCTSFESIFSSPNALKSASMLLSKTNNHDQSSATVVGRKVYTFLRDFIDRNVHIRV